MSDIPQTPNPTLPQALAQATQVKQASQLSAIPDAARQTVEVMVKQLSGNLVNLSRTRTLLSKPAILPQPVIQGKLSSSATHTVRASLESPPVLEFFSTNGPSEQKTVPLSEQQIQALLKLPPKQLVASIINSQSAAVQKLAAISATVISNGLIQNNGSTQLQTPSVTVKLSQIATVKTDPATIQADSNKLVTQVIKLQLAKTPLPIELTLPNKQTAQFITGEKVALSLIPKGVNWQLTMQPQAKPQLQAASQVDLNKPLLGEIPQKAENQLNKAVEKAPAQNLLIPPKDAISIVKAVLTESSKSKNKAVNLELVVKQVLQHLTRVNSAESKQLIGTIQKQPIDKLNLNISPNNKIQLKFETNKPVATIPITREIAQALAPLKLPNQQNILKLANQLPPAEKPVIKGGAELIVNKVVQHLAKIKSPESLALFKTLQKQPIDKLSLQINSADQIQLKLESNKPAATILITKEIAQALAPLKLPNQQNLMKLINQLPPTEKPTKQPLLKAILQLGDSAKRVFYGQSEGTLLKAETSTSPKQAIPPIIEHGRNTSGGIEQTKQSGQKTNIADSSMPVASQTSVNRQHPFPQEELVKRSNQAEPLANTKQVINPENKTAEKQVDLKQLADKLMHQVQTSPVENSVITPKLLTDKNQQHQLVQQLLRVVQAKAETPSVKLQSIEKMLTDTELTKASTEVSNKQIIEQVLQQTKTALPQGKEMDAQNIKQLLSSPALNLSANKLISPSNSQGLISGLITLLQVSLSSRIARNQNSRSELVARTLHSVLPLMGKTKPAVTSKSLNEFSQLEQKHQLMREIGRMLSGHQANKLTNAEQLLQGQDSFYYNLPTLMGGVFKDAEILIKREEHQEQKNEAEEGNNQTWQLTMKLSVGELGELLTKAKLRPDNLEVNFYASNDTVKIQVMNYLPLFKRKLESLGIEVSKSQCQLGKIPDSLQQRPYHVFQTKV